MLSFVDYHFLNLFFSSPFIVVTDHVVVIAPTRDFAMCIYSRCASGVAC